VSKSLVRSQVVNSYDGDIWVSKTGTEEVTTDASKTIDSDINHESVLATSGACAAEISRRGINKPSCWWFVKLPQRWGLR
jgi:hypothetical protein